MYTKEQIMSVLEKAYEDSRFILLGEQLIGPKDLPNDMFGRFSEATGGRKPAILGLDLACYGLDLMNVGINTERWKLIIDQVTAFAEEGGIVTASSHFANPIPRPDVTAPCRGAFGGLDAWEDLLTEGTEMNKIFKEELLTDGEFLRQLGERGVTVLWRPLHEANSGSFWYCGRAHGEPGLTWMDGNNLKRLWKYIYNLYVNEMGLTNLIWVYAPNNQGTWSGNCDVNYYYPGDEYVDMVGLDWYTRSKQEIIVPKHSYDKMMGKGKVCAMTEFGPAGDLAMREDHEAQEKVFNAVDMLNLYKDLSKRGLKIAYVLTWHENFGAIHSIGRGKEALDDGFFYDLERLKDIYSK